MTSSDTRLAHTVTLPAHVEAATPGVTVLINDQQCAAEKRRMRRRGTLAYKPRSVFINGELIGGCDITVELSESGELARLVADAQKA